MIGALGICGNGPGLCVGAVASVHVLQGKPANRTRAVGLP